LPLQDVKSEELCTLQALKRRFSRSLASLPWRQVHRGSHGSFELLWWDTSTHRLCGDNCPCKSQGCLACTGPRCTPSKSCK